MITKLDRTVRREIEVDRRPYVITIDGGGLLLTAKGRRRGISLLWRDLLSGDAAMANALNATLSAMTEPVQRQKGRAVKKAADARKHPVRVGARRARDASGHSAASTRRFSLSAE